jgi:hypothetical protein
MYYEHTFSFHKIIGQRELAMGGLRGMSCVMVVLAFTAQFGGRG